MTSQNSNEEPCFTYVDKHGGQQGFSALQVYQAASRLAAIFQQQAAKTSATIAVDLPNSPLVVFALLACALSDVPLVLLNNRLSPAEKQLRLQQLDGAGLQVAFSLTQENASRLLEELSEAAVIAQAGALTPRGILDGARPDGIATIMFTSGTTGTPKATPLTWGQLLASAEAANQSLDAATPDTCWQAALPLYHIGGLQVALRSLMANAPFLLYEHADPHALLQDAKKRKCTHISVVDKLLQDLLAADAAMQGGGIISHYRCLLLGGGALNPQTLQTAKAAHARVFASFGMTETASQIANALVDESFDGGANLLPNIQARILDPNQNGEGNLALKGPCITSGYLNAPTPLTPDGFFITGDRAKISKDKLYVLERTADMFVSGGENVYPVEIERLLNQVEGVTASYVFGLPDPTWGRRPAAVVESPQDPQAILARVQEHTQSSLSRFSQPVFVLIVKEMPRQGIGKIDRQAAQALVEKAYSPTR